MARIRSVHPGLFTDEAWVSCSPMARLLVIGLWTEADDQGVFEWKPLQLKMRLLPGDAVNVADLLEEIRGAGLVLSYESDGRRYGAIRNFRKFQRPQKPNALHPLPETAAVFVGLCATNPEPVRDQYATDPGKPQQMEDGGGRGEEDEGGKVVALLDARPSASEPDDDWPEGSCAHFAAKLTLSAGPGLGDPAKHGTLLTSAVEIARWRQSGCSWTDDVVPTIEALTQQPRPRPITSWTYFTPAVLEAAARRNTPLTIPEGPTHERARPDQRRTAHAERLEDIDAAMRAACVAGAG